MRKPTCPPPRQPLEASERERRRCGRRCGGLRDSVQAVERVWFDGETDLLLVVTPEAYDTAAAALTPSTPPDLREDA